ncbi:MAG: hypothetical protein ACYCXK_11100 [Candidatus Humimicrobiaceae bacterium]
MNLYLLKCQQGYLKKDGIEDFAIVPLEKASVFKHKTSKELIGLREKVILSGIKEVSLVMLTITEKVLENF